MKPFQIIVSGLLMLIAVGVWASCHELRKTNIELKRLNGAVEAIKGLIPI